MPNVRSAVASPATRHPDAPRGSSPPAMPGVAGASVLSFTIGQDASGCWVALERHGVVGGLFRSRDAAIHYAGGEIRNGDGEIRFAAGPVAFTVGR